MGKGRTPLIAGIFALMLLVIPAQAQDFYTGLAAALRGDYATALQEWRPLAEQGDASAQFNLGWMYDKGEGVPQDDREAVRWYRRAAEQGDAKAQNNLGVMYNNGEGVAQDYREAVRWYRRAAEQGNAKAQNNLGMMYNNGEGVAQDYITAHVWFNIAAANGNTKASENRDIAASKLSADALIEAQRLARQCLDSTYQNCP